MCDYISADSKVPTDHQVVHIMSEESLPPLRMRTKISLFALSLQNRFILTWFSPAKEKKENKPPS